MGTALFYHLTRTPAEALLPRLIARAQASGWRIELRGTEAARMARIDEILWQGDGFVPHGLAGGPHDARQPVLLTVAGAGGARAANDPACLMALDGAAVAPAECAALDRTCILFNGGEDLATDHARGQWRALTEAGVAAEYWSEQSGRWERKG